MSRYYINEVKCGVGEGGFACGPVPGPVTASVQYKKNDGPYMWITLSEVDGIAGFYLSEEDIYDKVQEMDVDDEEFTDKLNDEYYIKNFDGISFGDFGEYDDILQNVEKNEGKPAANVILYLVALVRCDWDELEGLIATGKGKYSDEIDLGGIDVE